MFGAKFLRNVLVLTVLGTVAAFAAPVVWHMRGHDAIIPPEPRRPAPVTQAPKEIEIDPILSLAPFGAAVQTANTQPQSAQKLDMVLLGVIVRDDPKRSLALIGTPKGEANYRVGDSITEGAVLKNVAASFVLLDLEGVEHKLSFTGAQQVAAQDDVPSGMDRLMAMMTTGVGTTISEQVDQAAKTLPVTTQDYIDYWRDRIRANPAEVLDKIGLIPTENGYIIAENHDSGVTRAGLLGGDIVRTVNGQTVGDVDSDRALYDRVAESGLARVEIERNGKTIVFSFPLQ